MTEPKHTQYLGAHRWTLTQPRSWGAWDWECTCGDTGRVATSDMPFLQDSFARHAYDKLMTAATTQVLRQLPHTRDVYQRLLTEARIQQETGDKDQGNILMMAANMRHHEAAEALRRDYESLRWTSWPEYNSEGRAVEVEDIWTGRFWLKVEPGERGWAWHAYRVTQEGDEIYMTQGSAPGRSEAQEAAWEALVKYQEDLEDQELPF